MQLRELTELLPLKRFIVRESKFLLLFLEHIKINDQFACKGRDFPREERNLCCCFLIFLDSLKNKL